MTDDDHALIARALRAAATAQSGAATRPGQLRSRLEAELGPVPARRLAAQVHQLVAAAEEHVPAMLTDLAPLTAQSVDRIASDLATTRGWAFATAQRATMLWAGALGLFDRAQARSDDSVPAHDSTPGPAVPTQPAYRHEAAGPPAFQAMTDSLPSNARTAPAPGDRDRVAAAPAAQAFPPPAPIAAAFPPPPANFVAPAAVGATPSSAWPAPRAQEWPPLAHAQAVGPPALPATGGRAAFPASKRKLLATAYPVASEPLAVVTGFRGLPVRIMAVLAVAAAALGSWLILVDLVAPNVRSIVAGGSVAFVWMLRARTTKGLLLFEPGGVRFCPYGKDWTKLAPKDTIGSRWTDVRVRRGPLPGIVLGNRTVTLMRLPSALAQAVTARSASAHDG